MNKNNGLITKNCISFAKYHDQPKHLNKNKSKPTELNHIYTQDRPEKNTIQNNTVFGCLRSCPVIGISFAVNSPKDFVEGSPSIIFISHIDKRIGLVLKVVKKMSITNFHIQ